MGRDTRRRRYFRPPPPANGERQFVSFTSGRVLGTESQREREAANMARLRGTGKDPAGRYSEGTIFDVPDDTPEQGESLVEKGWAVPLDPKDDPGRTEVQVANAIVRNDPMLDPVDREVAAGISKPREVVHGEDVYAADGVAEEADTHRFSEGGDNNRSTLKRDSNQLGDDDITAPASQSRRSSGGGGRQRATEQREDKAQEAGQS